jgi:hypothetical protein
MLKNATNLDPQVYDLDHCIRQRQKPVFGYQVPQEIGAEAGDVLGHHLFRLIVAKEREHHIHSHVLKCFTYGKKVKKEACIQRQEDDHEESKT